MAPEINELTLAEQSISKMKSASNLDDYEMHWKSFLHYLDRAWNKLEVSIKSIGASHKIRNSVRQSRKKDALIQYLFQARNTDEHTIEEIVLPIGGYTTITGKVGGAILRGSIEGSGKVNSLVTVGNIAIKFHPDKLLVTAVKNKGDVYQPPREHLGIAISTLIPHELAEMGLVFYKTKIGEIRAILP